EVNEDVETRQRLARTWFELARALESAPDPAAPTRMREVLTRARTWYTQAGYSAHVDRLDRWHRARAAD
ncbi:MAG: hypothetical protein AAGC55_20280, partial [Myxococcota bacterium]